VRDTFNNVTLYAPGAEAASDLGATQDAGPALAIGLALGACLLVTALCAAIFVWHRKRMQPPEFRVQGSYQPPPSSASTAAPHSRSS